MVYLAERMKRIRVLAAQWRPDFDVLTSTMKLTRQVLHTRYADDIEQPSTA